MARFEKAADFVGSFFLDSNIEFLRPAAERMRGLASSGNTKATDIWDYISFFAKWVLLRNVHRYNGFSVPFFIYFSIDVKVMISYLCCEILTFISNSCHKCHIVLCGEKYKFG
jgi:hypothetical protein